MKCRAALFLFLATGLALAACPKTSQPEVGGETNWLRVCTDRDGCGVGSCVCGVCTTECASESRCSGAFAGSCVSTTSQLGASACAEAEQVPPGLCLPGCASDSECGSGFACRDSVCVTVAIAEHFDTEPPPPTRRDAGACRVAERCEQGEWCDWTSAQARALECYMPFAGPYTARCGRYDSVVSRGDDSAITYYYGEDGALVGTNSTGLGNEGCVSYDDLFALPASCTPTSPPCSDDAGMADAGASDAGTTDSGASDGGTMDAGTTDSGTVDTGTSEGGQQDSASPLCDCANEEVSLACVCALGQGWCLTFEQAVTNVCGSMPFPPSLEQGCGYKMIRRGAGLGFQTYVYQGADDTLVGASIIHELSFGSCGRNSYRTQMPNLETCADYSICDLCPTGANPCQL